MQRHITVSIALSLCVGGCDLAVDEADDLEPAEPAAKRCPVAPPRPAIVDTLPRDSIDTGEFMDRVVADLGANHMGYSALLIGRAGAIIGSAKYGYARTACEDEGELSFNHNTQTAWGSVTKVLTTALVIDKVERSSQSLDETMRGNLPADWRAEMASPPFSPHNAVTIRHLLGQVSGFAGSNGQTLRERVNGPLEKPIGLPRTYSNANFAIFQRMGRFFRQGYFDTHEASLAGNPGKDALLELLSLEIYKDAFQARIADKIGGEFSCNDPDHTGDNYSHYYSGPTSAFGYQLSPIKKTGCTTGGIVMSPRDMAAFLRALTRTDDIISSENYQTEMAIPDNDRLGWDYAISVDGGMMYGKDGARTFGAVAEIVAFPNGTSALIVSNSRSGATNFRAILKNAYNASVN